MSKHILVLEPSVTLQAILKEQTKKTELELSFDTNGIRFLVTLYNSLPNAVLINARNMNPGAAELVRLIKSTARFRQIPVGVYATSDFLFSEEFVASCGADGFITFSEETIISDLEELCALQKMQPAPETSDLIQFGALKQILETTAHLTSMEAIADSLLTLIAKCSELPCAALIINEGDGAEGFYISARTFSESDTADFVKVCTSDFEEHFPAANMANFSLAKIETTAPLENFHAPELPLSAYHMIPISDSFGIAFASLHVLKAGAFTTNQLKVLTFVAEHSSILLKTAIREKEKLKFERNIRKAFSRFVPEQIIDELVDSAETEAKVGVGEKRDVAILFSDIRSFTNISERNKPEVIVAFLNRYFTIMCTIIKKHGGTIDKFIGDAIMALFGAPVSYEDNAARAVAAAREMREALENVPLDDLILPDGMKFNIGIGIHYGDVIVGSIGSDDKTDYSVIGDAVNLASRLEGLTKQYGSMILVSQAVKDDIKTEKFAYRHLDEVKVKGKAQAVPIYAVDRDETEFPSEYKNAYTKGFLLYKQGVWNLAKEYFEKALAVVEGDKAAKLMCSRCEEFIKNPPENWDGAIAFTTK